MNSAPTSLLRNTSAGIMEPNIYKLPARIVAKPDDGGEGEHLELVLGDHMEEKSVEENPIEKSMKESVEERSIEGKSAERRTIRVNQVYG